MRDTLKELFGNTIIHKYSLPHENIGMTSLSTESDECYSVQSNQALSKLIYNGIVEYSLGEKHVDIN
ncbi:MAG: hypothetical protein MJ073_06520, partial [Oscillibacter sp.]|nr:hypothetical protein [Oscillibacter sp.]